MQLIINGESTEVPESVQNVAGLLAHLGLTERIVVVELNQEILHRASHAQTPVAAGDRIEIVHFVGGG